MNIYLEIFGYVGTVLVIISMMMTSFLKFRIINMCGGFISLIYAVLTNTWPVAVLNACLVCINFVQTIRQLKKKENFAFVNASVNDGTFRYFLSNFEKKDVSDLSEDDTAFLIFNKNKAAGFVAGEKDGAQYKVKIYCTVAEYKDVKESLFAHLKKEGIDTLIGFDGNNVINI